MKIVETSLNLRIERGKCKDNYLISEYIAKKQLSISDTDIYSNVEFMDCDNTAYLKVFENSGYNSFISSLDKRANIFPTVVIAAHLLYPLA